MRNRNIVLFYFLFFGWSLSFFVSVDNATASQKKDVLKISLLPIADTFPVYVAEEQGYFAEENITVEILQAGSGLAQNQMLQAGLTDGLINEINGAASYNRDKVTVQIIAVARVPQKNSPLFRIVVSPQSTISKPSELAGVPIGISRNTVIEYISDRLLENSGVAPQDIKYNSVPVLPERLQLVLSGQLQAATIPDPLAASAIAAGAKEILSDLQRQELSLSVITFTAKAIGNKKEAIKAFMRSWTKAARDINNNPEKWRKLFLQKVRVPENVKDSYIIPPYPVNILPTKEQWDDVMQWMVSKGQLKENLKYEYSVSREFIEE